LARWRTVIDVSAFPPKNRGDVYYDLLERLGASSRPRLERCTVCGHRVWRTDLHGHRACLDAAGYRPPDPVRPDPVIGNVYALRLTDSHEAQVSERTGRSNERRAAADVAAMPKCRVCRRPMTCDQRGTHHSCRPADQTKETS
jgi:hypothetical protein